jgi:hypothetical protein
MIYSQKQADSICECGMKIIRQILRRLNMVVKCFRCGENIYGRDFDPSIEGHSCSHCGTNQADYKKLEHDQIILKHQKERYPSSEIRMKWMGENVTDEMISLSRKVMHATLHFSDKYLMKIYEQRDLALSLMKMGYVKESIEVLKMIGFCGSEDDHLKNEKRILEILELLNVENNKA